jgi:serine/threonine protein kinase
VQPPEPAHALIGELVDDRYRIRRLISRGGMGAVYEAEAVRLGRLCAFKVLLPEYTRNETAVQRFRREALVASRVKHPHVVDIFDTGTTTAGLGYIAMELLHGESLGRTLRREKRLPWPRARHIALQMCRALTAAHARGVIHRDMKPDNCFRLTLEGDPDFIKILDFGIAKLVDPESADGNRLTATDSMIGTYSYMAYEQIKGLDPDPRVDIWAVGVILYEMLTGTLPFQGQNERQVWSAIFSHTPVPIRDLVPDAGIPPQVDDIVARALEKSRDARWPTADALAQALEQVEGPRTRTTGPLRAVPPQTAAPDAAVVDSQAETIVRPATTARPPIQRTEPVSPHDLTELDNADIRADTHESGRREIVPTTDPIGHTELAPVAESAGTASAPRPVLAELAALKPPARSRAWPWMVSATAFAMALVWLTMFRGDAEEVPVVEAVQPPVVPQPEPIEDTPPAPAEQHRESAPENDESGGLPDPPSEPVPLAAPDSAEPKGELPQLDETITSPPVAPVSYKQRVEAALKKYCTSKPVRECLTKYKQGPVAVTFLVKVKTGKVDPDFTPELGFETSAPGHCLVEKMKEWNLPKAGSGERDFKHSCILKR